MDIRILFFVISFIAVAVSTPVLPRISGIINKPIHPEINRNQELYGFFGGQNVTIKKHNYVGSLLFSDTGALLGSVTVIDKQWVVGAAMSFQWREKEEFSIRLGSSETRSKGSLLYIEKIIKHPQFKGDWDYNIALVKLNTSIKFQSTIGKTSVALSLPKEGTNATVLGWSNDYSWYYNLLRKTTLPIVSSKTCKREYYGSEASFTNRSLCTAKSFTGPCYYDAGDPLLYNHKLIGLFSGTLGCTLGNLYPGVYADVTQYRKWILETIKNNKDD